MTDRRNAHLRDLMVARRQRHEPAVAATSVRVRRVRVSSALPLLVAPIVLIGLATAAAFWATGEPTLGSVSLLSAIAVASIGHYRGWGNFAGSLPLISAAIAAIYSIGLLPRHIPVLGIDVSPPTQAIVVTGSFVFYVALAIVGATLRPPEKQDRSLSSLRHELQSRSMAGLLPFALIAIAVAAVNYATGDIPLLSGDVNGSRLNGSYGLLGRFWPLALPVLQVVVIATGLQIAARSLTRVWAALGLLSLGALVLNGGRSLTVICLLALLLVLIDVARPSLLLIGALTSAGLLAFGAIGLARSMGSAGSAESAAYLSARDLDSWWGSTDLSLQTGPRVLDLAVTYSGQEHLGGQLLLADLANLFDSSVVRADRVVTLAIGRDPDVVGGMPPTIWGGFYLDYGWLGVMAGPIVVAAVLLLSRRMMLRGFSMEATVWFGYVAAYVLIGSYSYVGFRPSWMVVLLLCVAMKFSRRRAMNAVLRADGAPLGPILARDRRTPSNAATR